MILPALDQWMSGLILLPLAAGLGAFLLPLRGARVLALTVCSLVLLLSMQMIVAISHTTEPLRHVIGGWSPPLGISLFADGLTVTMLTMTASVALFVSVYAIYYFADDGSAHPPGSATRERHFWPLWMMLIAGLNALFLSRDVFNLYVTLEVIGFTSAGLIALSGTRAALGSGLRYLLISLAGSLFYLLGVALVYLGYRALDLDLLAQIGAGQPTLDAALALMSAGLVMKTALVPFHSWLPGAHANAPSPVSAALSALVIKGTFYLLLRLWVDTFEPGALSVQLLAVLGCVAVIYGCVQAIRAVRLKMLVAWSTVAQVGYLFMTPLLVSAVGFAGLGAGVYIMLSHAFAKAAMFLAAGTVLHVAGTDRIDDLESITRRAPLSLFAMGAAGLSLMGLPPSGGFTAKWMLLNAAIYGGLWWLAAVVFVGSLLAAAYMFRLTGYALTRAGAHTHEPPAPAVMEWTALLLALAGLLMGFGATPVLELLRVGATPAGAAWLELAP